LWEITAELLAHIKLSDLQVIHEISAKRLSQAGYASFDDFWDLPQDFVEPANIRRNGWSGVSTLQIEDLQGNKETFYLKRQENQSRYSLRYLTGVLTFRYEADALSLAQELGWPSVELVAYAFRVDVESGASQGLLLTRALTVPNLADFEDKIADWSLYLPQLRRVGEQLLSIHMTGWQHGALFPVHIFIELSTGAIRLIDFERARKRFSPQWAAYADLVQFIRRADWLPDEALNAIVQSHKIKMPRMLERLRKRFPKRTF